MMESFTSPTIDDMELDSDNTYNWDCCNIDYCKVYREPSVKFSCLKGHTSPRCTRDEKLSIRQEAIAKSFAFPIDSN